MSNVELRAVRASNSYAAAPVDVHARTLLRERGAALLSRPRAEQRRVGRRLVRRARLVACRQRRVSLEYVGERRGGGLGERGVGATRGRRVAPATLKQYTGRVGKFHAFCDRMGFSRSFKYKQITCFYQWYVAGIDGGAKLRAHTTIAQYATAFLLQ